jgi:7-alpha-hydroxysteroid dehydrogenase
MQKFDLTDRVAIVTGGSQGLGKAVAIALAQAGADVAIAAREPEAVTFGKERPHLPVDPAVEEIAEFGTRVIGVTTDVRDPEQVNTLVARTMDTFGRIDILVNVVGGSWGETFKAGPLMTLDLHDVMEAYKLNVGTMFLCSKAVQPIMKQQGKGAIVNIASVAGRGASINSAAYGAAKAGVINMSMTMAHEWGPEIRVNAIAVGGIETPHRQRWGESQSTEAVVNRSVMKRLGTPEEHAGTVLWLVSDYGGYITGIVIDAHGGARV